MSRFRNPNKTVETALRWTLWGLVYAAVIAAGFMAAYD